MNEALLHGWSGLVLAYASVQGPMLAGMLSRRAPSRKLVLSPLLAVPLTITAGVALALLPHGSWVFGMGVCATLGLVAGRRAARDAAEDATLADGHVRGATVVRHPAARPSHQRGSRAAGITLAGVEITPNDEVKHFKIIGATGTGKSTAIREIMGGALARGDRAIIADPDGGYLKRFYDPARGDVILNPFDSRSVKWDLFAEVETTYDVEQLARSLIPDHEGADRSWRGYARTFFSAVTAQARAAGVRDVGELYRLLVVADTGELRTLVRGTPAQPFLDEHNSRMFDSIRSVTTSAVGALEHIAAQKGAPFSVRQWVRSERPGVLFVPYKAGQIAALRSTISAWMRLAIFETMDREELPSGGRESGERPLWFVIDELDALGQIDGLKDALARLRKFGGRCLLGFQSIAQVSSTYGAGEAHTIVENCGNSYILRCSASEGGGTARFASQLIGEREVLRTTHSSTRRWSEFFSTKSVSEHYSVEAAVLPAEIERLPDLAGYLKLASNPGWLRTQLAPTHERGDTTHSAAPAESSVMSIWRAHRAAQAVRAAVQAFHSSHRNSHDHE